jgi:hypothetical protein
MGKGKRTGLGGLATVSLIIAVELIQAGDIYGGAVAALIGVGALLATEYVRELDFAVDEDVVESAAKEGGELAEEAVDDAQESLDSQPESN